MAVLARMGFSVAAAMQKHEALRFDEASFAIARVRSGAAYGLAAGVLYAASAVFTKEVGDRFAVLGWGAVGELAKSPAPWLLIPLGLIALAYVMSGFRLANAAAVLATL